MARVCLIALTFVLGCSAPPSPKLVTSTGLRPLPASLATAGQQAMFDRRLALRGARLEAPSVVWLEVAGELASRKKPELVVRDARGERTAPIALALSTVELVRGDVLEVPLPRGLTGAVHVGISDGGRRWPARAAQGGPISDELVPIGSVDDDGDAKSASGFVAVRASTPIVVDGVLDEPVWNASTAHTLRPHKAGGAITQATTVRFAVDDDAVYVAFDVDDDDPHSPYTTRDDPLYDSEATELFIDADGDGQGYVELQASPRDVQFDARFFGGARQGMDKAFDVAFVTKTSSRAGGYTQEWRVPRAAVPDASPTDTTWRINVYRLERRRRGDVVVGTEASALSPPERNDFHALDRMVALTLAPR